MIETATLATYIVGSFLVPLAKKGAEKLTEELSEKVGSAAADGLVGVAKTLWSRIRGKSRETEDEPVLDLFEQQPEKLETALLPIVERMLEQDPDFNRQATELVEASQGGEPGWRLMGEYVGVVNAQHAKISGGQVAGVIIGQPGPTPLPPESRPDRG